MVIIGKILQEMLLEDYRVFAWSPTTSPGFNMKKWSKIFDRAVDTLKSEGNDFVPFEEDVPDKGSADRFRSDSADKEAIQNTGMSGAGGGKGKDKEPTKDDERSLAWKLRLSVETPKFNASATLSLEKKRG
ncbi:hypothetical protein EZV62_026147 [Acer yangbiense]|uniref:Uncharacterized protein n=1 Tax=Acer yangbiense TaxID=1000413 RepID=A0A5C7GQJ5_9ROSI|nr:hypothetical protein EZV62_026147 [Acer yangbiense]